MKCIHAMNISKLDLNLLLVLEALLLERSVSRAASRLRQSQPATSNALARLREALGDPLFVRGRDGMAPTERALSLARPLEEALGALRGALETPPEFDPATARRTFVLAASDHAQLVVLPELARRLAAWPGLVVRAVPLPRDFPARELEAGELDLVIGAFGLAPGDRAPVGLRRQLLLEERYVGVARRGHPALSKDLEAAFALPQLHVAPRGGVVGKFERRTRRPPRNVVLFTPHYLVAPWVLSTTDLVAALPERVARLFAASFPLELRPLDFVDDRLRLEQLWHPRAHALNAHRWLRGQLVDAVRAQGERLEVASSGTPARRPAERRR